MFPTNITEADGAELNAEGENSYFIKFFEAFKNTHRDIFEQTHFIVHRAHGGVRKAPLIRINHSFKRKVLILISDERENYSLEGFEEVDLIFRSYSSKA